jgi:hypothetical protein
MTVSARRLAALPGVDLRSSLLHERQDVVEILKDDILDNLHIEIAVLMNSQVAKADHLLQPVAQPGINDLLANQYRERIPALAGYTQSAPPDQHVCEIDRRIAGAYYIENGSVLQIVVRPKFRAGIGQHLARPCNTALHRGYFLSRYVLDHEW